MNDPLGLIVSLTFAGAFFLTGLYAIRHRWRGVYVIGILAAGFVFALTGQPWVQTRVLSILKSGGKSHEGSADGYRQSVGEMQRQIAGQQGQVTTQQMQMTSTQRRLSDLMGQVSAQQTAISSQQVVIVAQATDLAAQQERLKTMQQALNDALSGLDTQQKRLADTESLIKNLYKRKRIDTFQRSDRSRVQLFQKDQTAVAVFRLKEPAVSKSVDGYFGNSAMKPSSLTSVKNVVVAVFSAKTNEMPQEYSFTYTVNPNDTPFAGEVTITDNQIVIGSEVIAVP
jgi:hypothetical protein